MSIFDSCVISTFVKLWKAAEEICVDQKGEPLPVWTPPTPPQQDEYRVDPWAAAYEQQPLNMPMKRFKVLRKLVHWSNVS